jgi:hypothetical protein
MIVRLLSGILGVFWVSVGLVLATAAALGITFFTVPCVLQARLVCPAVESMIIEEWFFSQIGPETLRTWMWLLPLSLIVLSVQTTAVGVQLFGHINRKNAHAPALGVMFGLLAGFAMLFGVITLNTGGGEFITEYRERSGTATAVALGVTPTASAAATLLPNTTPSPTPAAEQATATAERAVTLAAQAQITAAQANIRDARVRDYEVGIYQITLIGLITAAVIATVSSTLMLGKIVKPAPKRTFENHQCHTCGIVGIGETPRCALCHAPVLLSKVELSPKPPYTPGSNWVIACKISTSTSQLTSSAQAGLPARKPELRVVTPKGITLSKVVRQGGEDTVSGLSAVWALEVLQQNRKTLWKITGPAYLTDEQTLELHFEIDQALPQRTITQPYTLSIEAYASNTKTDSKPLSITVTRDKNKFEQWLETVKQLLCTAIQQGWRMLQQTGTVFKGLFNQHTDRLAGKK